MNVKKKVILSLGGNIENREGYINKAIMEVEKAFKTKVDKSGLYETASWGFEAEFPFLNVCISFYSSCNPKELLNITQNIEKNLGRVKKSQKGEYESRVIDIDILYIEELIINTEKLTVPHPLIYGRNFVLTPLLELCPDFVDPVKKTTIKQLHKSCNDKNKVILYKN
ncbi:MAG TPA: 2-amino-4-hydroxy-6-hydroxymethyldihydropteridine diphosphokinase [Brumimicrobium sp.]|nr:2-amino-4-hydroxy-6-hydroxymethyldihydropteridine diphosphokinase [Brumimicrobium sp.]